MPSLLELPLRVLDLATRPTRFAARTVWGLVHRDEAEDEVRFAPAAPAPPPEPAPPTAAAPEAKPKPKPKPRAKPSPKAARRATRHEPTRGEAGAIREQRREEEQNAGGPGPGATIVVAPPWEGYDALTEDQVLDRLTGADPTVRAAVRLYEGTHAERRQILLATE